MKQTEPKSLNLDTIGLIKIAMKWKKHLLVIFIGSVMASFVFTLPFFIPEKFKSTAVLYPSNLVIYSTESPTEQMLQQLASEAIRLRIINTFNLYHHYDIDTTKAFPVTRMFNAYDGNIKFNKTQFESVEIEVWDTDPLMASAICDSLISFVNQNIIKLQRIKAAEVVLINKKLYENLKTEIDSMEAALTSIRRDYGILDYRYQSRELSKVYYQSGSSSNHLKIQKEISNLQEKGGDFNSLTENLTGARKSLVLLKTRYEKARSDLSKELTYCNVVTAPMPAEKKAYPKRSLIIVLFTVSVTVLSLLIILMIEKYNRDIKPALQTD